MDCASTCHSMVNSALHGPPRLAKRPVNLATNTGSKRIDLEADVPSIGTAQVNDNGIANIISLGKLVRRGYRVTMDTDVEECFKVHCDDDRIVKFDMTEEGLFAYKPSENY